jgi:hypothetical protein
MRNVHPAAFSALHAAHVHAQQTRERIQRSVQHENLSMSLLAKSRDDVRRSRARLAQLAASSRHEPPAGSNPEQAS